MYYMECMKKLMPLGWLNTVIEFCLLFPLNNQHEKLNVLTAGTNMWCLLIEHNNFVIHIFYRYILMLIFIILRTTHGVEASLSQKKWQIHILEWHQMEDTFMQSLDNMVRNVEGLQLNALSWTQRQNNGRTCQHYLPLGNLVI